MNKLEKRLIRIEEILYFQEKMIDELNEALVLQQKQLDIVDRNLNEAIQKLENMILNIEENRKNPQLEIPPHYQLKQNF